MGPGRLFPALLALLWLGGRCASEAHAELTLPYSDRTRGYSAWDASVRGDLRTIGMAGAMVGLADSYVGSVDNPAGLALTVDSTGLQLSGNTVQDGELQSYPTLIKSRSQVAMGSWNPWGFSMAIWSPQSSGDSFLVPGRPVSQPSYLAVETREYRLSAARLFKDHLAVGLTLLVGRNTQTIDGAEHSAYATSVAGGVQYLMPYRLIAGVSFTPALHFGTDPNEMVTTGVTHYYQPAYSPYRLGAGLGWIPNRFFRGSAAFYMIGATPEAGLLRDQSVTVGDSVSLQPRFGLSYLAIDYKELKLELELGTYVELTRIDYISSRWHGTLGIELKPWIFNLGWGLDEARAYQNFIVTFGVDVGAILRKLDLFPPERRVTRGGLFPNPFRISDEGLSHALVPGSAEVFGKPAIDVGLEAPEKLRNLFMNGPQNLGEGILQMGRDIRGTFIDVEELWPIRSGQSEPALAPMASPNPHPKRLPSER